MVAVQVRISKQNSFFVETSVYNEIKTMRLSYIKNFPLQFISLHDLFIFLVDKYS